MTCQQVYGAERTAASAINAQILTHCRDIVKNTGPHSAIFATLHPGRAVAGMGMVRHGQAGAGPVLPGLT